MPLPARQQGFTLFELVVVVVVVAILFSLMSLSLPSFSERQTVRTEAQRLLQLMTLAREEAIIQSRLMGFSHGQGTYRFFWYDGQRWTPADDSPLRERSLPEGIVLLLSVDGIRRSEPEDAEDEPSAELPELLFWPDGQINSFELSLAEAHPGDRGDAGIYRLVGSPGGSMELVGPDSEQ